jgi:N-acetylneuraminate synthase
MKNIEINNKKIGNEFSPYVIAEISANHNGKIENAFKLIEVAKNAGADAVKIQTYTADTITLNSDKEDFQIHGGLWDGQTLYQLYQQAYTPWEWHKPLFDYARKLGIPIFSSPFDNTAIDLLED